MIVWVKEHPILASISGLLVIVLLYMLLHRSSGSGGSRQVIQSGPSDALQTAGMAAQVQSQQISASLQAHQGDVAAALTAAVNQAGVQNNQTQAARDVALQQILTGGQVANYNAAAQVQINQSNNQASMENTRVGVGGAVQIAGIQADVAKNTTAAQLALGLDTNRTSLDLANISLSGLKDTNAAALAVSMNANQTAASIAAGREDTTRSGIAAQERVLTTAINWQGVNAGQSIGNDFTLAQQRESDFYGPNGLFVGVNRYGGNIKENQATIEAALLGQPSTAAAIQQSGAEREASSKSMWASIANGIIGTAGKVATAGIA